MARKERTLVTIVDDLTGEEQKEGTGATVPFVWEGKQYEIDLSDENAAKFHGIMAPYVEKGRRVRNSPAVSASGSRTIGADGRRRGGGRGMGRSKEELDGIRAWARANGHKVADSGLIPRRVLEAWERRETVPTTPTTPRPTPFPRDKAPETAGSGEATPAGVNNTAKEPEKKEDPVKLEPAPPQFQSPEPPRVRTFVTGRGGSDSR